MDISFDLVIVKHNPITVDRNVVGGGGVNPIRLASETADGDFFGAVDGSDEVFKFTHSITFVSVIVCFLLCCIIPYPCDTLGHFFRYS